jgi:hypothetical protein
MSDYTPDRWVVVKITAPNVLLYKVFACWYGGYIGSDSWQFNSGIKSVEEDESYFMFNGYSGSVYRCHKNSYGTNGYGGRVLQNFIDKADYKIEILPENTNWRELNYENK